MNPLILIGLGAVALMAMGGKKKPETEPEEEYPPEGAPITPMIAKKAKLPTTKKAVFAKLPPLDYMAQINSKGQDLAQQCMNQGVKEEMALTKCIADKLFSGWNWDNRSGWMNDAWPRIRNVARVKLGMDPIQN